MRVAVNAEQLLYRSPGGVGRYTAQLVSLLPQLFPSDEVLAFTAHHPRHEVSAAFAAAGIATRDGLPAAVLPLPRPVLYEAWSWGRGVPPLTWGAPRLRGADLVHAPSVAVPPGGGRPLVVTVHDAAPLLHPEAFPPRGVRFHRRGLAAAAARADVVLTVSEAAAAEIADHSPIPAARLRVVPNGVQPRAVPPAERASLLAARGLGGRPFVLWVGSLEPRKNVATLLAAMARLRRQGAPGGDADVVLAGYEGWLRDDLIDPSDRAVLGGALHQLGRVGEPELWALYAEAAVFAFPSWHEGFGLPVLEAMSQGTAVVAADIPAVREVAAGAALLVAPGDVAGWAEALNGLLADESARARASAGGPGRAAELGVERAVRGIRAVYAELLGG